MSAELDDQDAFDRVLDRLLEVNGRMQAYAAVEQFQQLTREVESHRFNRKNAAPKLAELYAAAVEARKFVLGANIGDSNTGDLAERLKKALAAAAPYCDQIPFGE
jgi:hypothetical protein